MHQSKRQRFFGYFQPFTFEMEETPIICSWDLTCICSLVSIVPDQYQIHQRCHIYLNICSHNTQLYLETWGNDQNCTMMILISMFWSILGIRCLQQLIEQILREGFFARKLKKITQENGSVHDRIESAGNLFLDRELKKVFTLPLLPFLGISLIWPKAALISPMGFIFFRLNLENPSPTCSLNK